MHHDANKEKQTMNIQTIRKPTPRIETPDISQLGIIAYGTDNLYPHTIAKLIANSETGTGCLNRYATFLQGDGFENKQLQQFQVNEQCDTLGNILHWVSMDLATYNGFALHVNYNALGEITTLSHVPFEFCRLCQLNDESKKNHNVEQVSHKIAIYHDWLNEQQKTLHHVKIKFGALQRNMIDYLDVFEHSKESTLQKIEKAGGIEHYKGQILWVSGAGKNEYPAPIYDCVATHLSIEEGLSNIAYKNTRNGLFAGGMLIVRRGHDTYAEDMNDTINAENYRNTVASKTSSIAQEIANATNDYSACNIMICETDDEHDKPEFLPFQSSNFDKEFSLTTSNATEKIYAAFGQEAFYRIRLGSFGFSSGVLVDSFKLYNLFTRGMRRLIESNLQLIFKRWKIERDNIKLKKKPLNMRELDFTIKPLVYDIG